MEVWHWPSQAGFQGKSGDAIYTAPVPPQANFGLR